MKSLIISILFLSSFNALSYDVPAKLKELMKGRSENIYKGITHAGDACEVKVSQNSHEFNIDGYERDRNGNIDINDRFGRFTLNEYHELEDYREDAWGVEAISLYYSSSGSEFDRKSIFKMEPYSDKEILFDMEFKRHNGIFMYTFYQLECVVAK